MIYVVSFSFSFFDFSFPFSNEFLFLYQINTCNNKIKRIFCVFAANTNMPNKIITDNRNWRTCDFSFSNNNLVFVKMYNKIIMNGVPSCARCVCSCH